MPLRRKQLSLGLFLGSFALSAPGFAQQYVPPLDVPPVHSKVDEFGVDIVTRQVAAMVFASISIGPNGPGGLRFDWASSNRAGTDLNVGLSVSGTTYSVYIGPNTTTFTLSGTLGTGTLANNQGGGETLAYSSSTGQFTYTTSAGSILVFSSSSGAAPYTAQTLTYPAGETLTYYSNGVVTSNLGYQFRPTLNANGSWSKAVLFNMNDETCDPTAATCMLTGNWPTIDFNAQTVNGNPVITWSNGVETIPISSTQSVTRSYSFDSIGRVNSVADQNGVWTYMNPGGAPNIVYKYTGTGTSSDPSRIIRQVQSDYTTGLITSDVLLPSASAVDATNYTYDSYQRIKTVNHNGVLTTFTYDGRGNATEKDITPTTGETTKNIVTTAAYPTSCGSAVTCNKPTSITDGNHNTTSFAYSNVHGGLTAITYPAVNVPGVGSVSPLISYTYTSENETWKNGAGGTVTGSGVYRPTVIARCMTQSTCTTTTNPNDQMLSTIAYSTTDGLQPSSVTAGSNASANPILQATTAYTYTPAGDVQTIDGPLLGAADTSWFSYDNDHRLTGVIGPDPDGTGGQPMRAVKVAYTNGGLVDTTSVGTATAQSSSALASMNVVQKLQASYNLQGLETQETLFDNASATAGVTQYSYTPERTLLCVAVRNNSSTWNSQPDACSQTTTATDLISKFTHDDVGNLLTVRSGYTSDSQTPDLANSWSSATMLASKKDGNGNTTTYSYDIFNRLSSTCYPDSSTDCELLTYDSNNNILSRRLRDGTTTLGFTYDPLNRLSTKALAEGTVAYGYDLLGNATSLALGGTSLTFTYDQLGRNLNQVGPLGTLASAYDLAGRRTQLTYPDGSYFNYDYLVTGDVSKIRENGSVSGVGVLAAYAYDALGNRSSITYGNGTIQSYAYDSHYRLRTLTNDLEGTATANDLTSTLSWNPADQITSLVRSNNKYIWANTSRNYTYGINSLNQYTGNGATSFGYDAKGNLNYSGGTYYCYNGESRLTAVGTASACGNPTATLAYDPAGRLSRVSASATGQFLYDGLDIVAEYDGSATPQLKARYVFGPGVDEPIVQYDGSGNRTFLTADERGSLIALSNSTGAVTGNETYDEYGIAGASNSTTERFQYTGQIYLWETGFYYYKNRLYTPTLGRFVQTDPIGYADGTNWYAYAHNDPINSRDPLGLCNTPNTPACDPIYVPVPCTLCNATGTYGPDGITITASRLWSIDPFSGGVRRNCGSFGCDTLGMDDPGGIWELPFSGMSSLPPQLAPNAPDPNKCRGGQAAGIAKAINYTGWAHKGFEGIAEIGGGGAAAKHALGPIGNALDALEAVATFTSSIKNGEPLDVATVRAAAPFVGALGGTYGGTALGAAAGGAIGGVVGDGVGAIPGAVIGGVAGGAAGGLAGEKLGDAAADEYAQLRGYGTCP